MSNDTGRTSEQTSAFGQAQATPARETGWPGKTTLTEGITGPIARSATSGEGPSAGAQQAVGAAAQSSGSGLPGPLRGNLESSLGVDLGGVRVHTGAESQTASSALQAKAWTSGQDVHFGAGQYDPGSQGGQGLIAHEVAHTVQQRGAGGAVQEKLEVSTPGDAHEVEAESFAQSFLAGGASPVSAVSQGTVSRQVISRVPDPPGGGTTTTGGGTTGGGTTGGGTTHTGTPGTTVGGPGGTGTPGGTAAPGTDDTWRGRGNLIGNPPVRDQINPPNKGIVEDESVFANRFAAASATRSAQEARANTMLDEHGVVKDNRYWFTKVYQFVTEGELEDARSHTFFYPSYVMQSVRYFDQIYANNVEAANAGGRVEDHWQRAFNVAANEHSTTLVDVLGRAAEVAEVGGGGLIGGLFGGSAGAGVGLGVGIAGASMTEELVEATQSLVASMQAHIRFDLPRAEAWVFSSYYAHMQDAHMANFQPDFMSMTGVFDRASVRMNAEMGSRIGIPTSLMPRMMQDWAMTHLLDADMATERADTWERAEALVNEGKAGTDPFHDAGDGSALTGDTTTTAQPAGSGLANISDPVLRPSMDNSAELMDDDDVRDQVDAGGVETKSTGERIRMIRGLLSGSTGDDDENAILAILRASATRGDVVTVVNGASAWDMMYSTDGSEYDELRSFLRSHYYTHTSREMATTLIRRCIDGETAEWEEEMIADFLIDRQSIDGRAIITFLGQAYHQGGFAEGVDEIQWQLDGSDQDRFDAAYGT